MVYRLVSGGRGTDRHTERKRERANQATRRKRRKWKLVLGMFRHVWREKMEGGVRVFDRDCPSAV